MATGFPRNEDFWQINNDNYVFTIRRKQFKRNRYFNLDDFLFSIKIDVRSGTLPKLFDILNDLDQSLVSVVRSLQSIYENVPENGHQTRANNLQRQIYITFQDTDDESSFVSVNSGKKISYCYYELRITINIFR